MEDTAKKQAKGFKWLFWTGYFCSIFAFLSLFVAYASPYWIQSWRRVHSPLANTGLWQICLSGYIKPRDPTLSAYVGCWWIHTTIFQDITNWIMPPWFRMVQAFTNFALLALILASVLLILFRPDEIRKALYRDVPHRLMFVNAGLLLLTAAMIFIDSMVFAMKVKDPTWMPRPHLNYLSWSYGFNVLAGFLAAYAGICVTLLALILKETKDQTDMPWQPKVEASKPVRAYPPAQSETQSERSYGGNSQLSQSYAPQHKPYVDQYYPSGPSIDRSHQKPKVHQYQPASDPNEKTDAYQGYTQRKPYVAPYKPSQPALESSYKPPRSQHTSTYQPTYNMPVKRAPKTSNHDDTKESDV